MADVLRRVLPVPVVATEPLEGSLEGQMRHFVRTKARGEGMAIDWGHLAKAHIADLKVED